MTQEAEEERLVDGADDGGEAAAAEPAQGRDDAASSPEQQLEEERQRAATYLDELQRERASFINYRRRSEQERAQWGREAQAGLIVDLLPVLDDFDRARETIPADQQQSAWVDGLMLVARKLNSTLELAGLTPIPAQGQPFDPALHEAVSTAPAEEGQQPGTVVQEFRKGYKLGDRVLRPSIVVVAQ